MKTRSILEVLVDIIKHLYERPKDEIVKKADLIHDLDFSHESIPDFWMDVEDVFQIDIQYEEQESCRTLECVLQYLMNRRKDLKYNYRKDPRFSTRFFKETEIPSNLHLIELV